MKTLITFVLIIAIPTFGFTQVDRVTVDKSERKMYLHEGSHIVKEFSISLGGNPKGHKQEEGDEKTPEGTYLLDYIKEDSSFYRSMHISYPNESDMLTAQERAVSPGGFIMIHGQKNYLGWLAPVTQRFNWTNGCIALTNAEMDVFLQLVPIGTSISIGW